ncbi:MAG: tetratricopeptide repeat protein [Acidobacteria bacterium]|nr:tetratricopeptide repeat protein [Acidobacteriota bacterium]
MKHPSRWRTRVLVGVHLLILVHIAHWLISGRTIAGLEPSEAMEFSKHGVINLGLILLVGAALITAVFGRFFCGWGCHIIAMQDLCRWLLIKGGIRPKPLRSRLLRWVPLAAFVYMFVWPIVYRLGAGRVFPPVTTALTTSNLWASMPGLVIGGLTIVVCGFAIVYVLGAKGFCTYACPYGALFGAADRLAPLRVRVNDDCNQCARCTAACTSNVRVHEQVRDFAMVRDSGCMKCLDCVAACPNDALYLGFGRPALGAKPRVGGPPAGRPWNVDWMEEIVLASAFVLAFGTFRGLYGRIPFLLALGLSGILAFLSLTSVRLAGTRNLRFGAARLKRDGRVTSAGWIFAFVMIVAGGLWIHSALVRFHEARAGVAFEETAGLRSTALDLGFDGLTDQAAVELVDQGRRHIDWTRKWGLISNPSSHFRASWFAFLQGRMESALASVEQALKMQPRASEVHLLHGRVLAAVGRPREAVMAFVRSVEIDPGAPQGFISLGSLSGALGDVSRAREVFRRGVLRHPENANLHYNFGVACAMEGDFDEAQGSFERALEINPEHVKARENLVGLTVFPVPVE